MPTIGGFVKPPFRAVAQRQSVDHANPLSRRQWSKVVGSIPTQAAMSLLESIMHRAGNRCAWCACRLSTGLYASKGVVCRLDISDEPSSMVASCIVCNAEFSRWWTFIVPYSVDSAKRILGRHSGFVFSGPFVEYLDRVAGFNADVPARAKRGYLTPFSTALARIEAQRHAPLDIRQETQVV